MIIIEKEKPAKEALKLFSIEVVLTPVTEDHLQAETNIQGHRAEMTTFLETMGVNPEDCQSILESAAQAMLKDFIQQIVNSSKRLESAEIKELED